MSTYDSEDDAPLDPAAARLRRKLVSLLFVSGGIMMLGLIAVFAAIVYKVNEGGGHEGRGLAAGAPVDARVVVPAGTRIVSTALDGDRALLVLQAADGSTSMLLVDLSTGAVLGRYGVGPN